MRDFPEDGGPEIRRFNFPLYGEDFLSAQRGSRSKEVEEKDRGPLRCARFSRVSALRGSRSTEVKEKDRGPLRCARLFLGLLAELGNQLVHHLFEFLTLPRL